MLKFDSVKTLYVMLILSLSSLVSCATHEELMNEALRELNINSKSDFIELTPCEQIKIYSTLGSKFTDIEHMVAIVPMWMHEEIALHPPEILTNCIVDEVNKLLAQWDNGNHKQISYSIHALFYKADELDLFANSKLDLLFKRVICEDKVFYNSQLVLIYYTEKFGVKKFPSHQEMFDTLCK